MPRLATLPEPSIGTTAPCTNSDSCYGESFERGGLFWTYRRVDDPGLPQ